MRIYNSIILLFITCSFFNLKAQEKIQLSLENPKIVLGDSITSLLIIEHDGKTGYNIVTDDSLYDDIRIVMLNYVPTKRLKNGKYIDSVWVSFRNFSTDSLCYFQLFIQKKINNRNVLIYSNLVKMQLQNPMLISKEKEFVSYVKYIPINKKTNWVIWGFFLILFTIAIIYFLLVWLPIILSAIRKRIFSKNHQQSMERLESMSLTNKVDLNEWLGVWKKDISFSTNEAIESWTLSQIRQFYPELKENLIGIDQYLYRANQEDFNKNLIRALIEFSRSKFNEKMSLWR